MQENKYNMTNRREWPSVYSQYMEDGGRLPVYWYEDYEPDPDWSVIPPIDEGHYWVFDLATRTSAVLHLYKSDEDDCSEPLSINVFGLPGLNPDVHEMLNKVLYGPQVFDTRE